MSIYSRKLTVELYKVKKIQHEQSLDNVLQHISTDILSVRTRVINQRQVRLDIIKPPSEDKPYWLLNFSCNLNRAPGQADEHGEVQDIELAEGKIFASDATVLYVPHTEFILIEYVHSGPRVIPLPTSFIYH